MARKKKVQVKAHKVKPSGVWIAPDLERKIKGEGGRRGLSEPPYSYYLHLADLVLKPATPQESASTPVAIRDTRIMVRDPLFDLPNAPPMTASTPALPTPAGQPTPPKPPKLALPKPPKNPKPPRPPRRPSSPKPPKFSMPKPPKRGR